MIELKLPELPEPDLVYDADGGEYTDEVAAKWAWMAHGADTGIVPYYSAAQMLAIRDQGIKYGMELAAQIVDSDEFYGNALPAAIAHAIRSKAVHNTVQVSGKEGV
jgi:hypothetical protein